MVSLAAMTLFAVWRGYDRAVRVDRVPERLDQPAADAAVASRSSLWFAGWALFGLCAAILAGHAALLFVRDQRELNRQYGPLTLEEEIEAEAGELLHGAPGAEAVMIGATDDRDRLRAAARLDVPRPARRVR